jgi:GNAT superfamily N-acetyltransferase
MAARGVGAAGMHDQLRVVPANQTPWQDVEQVLGKARCHGALCYCQRFKLGWSSWAVMTDEERAHRLREQTDCGHPESGSTSGLLAYADGKPIGWCNVEPRTAFPYLPGTRIAWKKRGQDKDDNSVWAAACFVTRTEFRHSGVSRALAAVAVEFARERGARAVEGYPMITEPGTEITWGELHVGSRSIFADAGFREVARPSLRRVVMRLDF